MQNSNVIRVLMLSGDPNIFISNNEAQGRMKDYSSIFDELHIVGFASKKVKQERFTNLFLYPVSGNAIQRFFAMYQVATNLCRRVQFDVISVQNPDEFGLIGYMLSRRFRIPLQIQIHTDIMSPWYRRASWKEWIRYHMARFLIPRADCIRVVSERIKKSLLHAWRKSDFPREVRLPKIAVLPIFTDIAKFLEAKANPKTEKHFHNFTFKMLAVGRFVEKEKNFLMLIDMMRDFIRICPKSLLVLVGDGPDKMNYEFSIKRYGLEKNVIIESWRDDLPMFYKSFDLFLLSSNYEGWGRVVIEAMAVGIAVVMTDVGLAGQVAKHDENCIVVPVGNTRIFLNAVRFLYENPEKRKRLGNTGREEVKSMRPRTKEDYVRLYKESLSSCLSRQ